MIRSTVSIYVHGDKEEPKPLLGLHGRTNMLNTKRKGVPQMGSSREWSVRVEDLCKVWMSLLGGSDLDSVMNKQIFG